MLRIVITAEFRYLRDGFVGIPQQTLGRADSGRNHVFHATHTERFMIQTLQIALAEM